MILLKKKKKMGYSSRSRLGWVFATMGVPCTSSTSKSIMKIKRGESFMNIQEILSSKLTTILEEDPAAENQDIRDEIICSHNHNNINIAAEDHHTTHNNNYYKTLVATTSNLLMIKDADLQYPHNRNGWKKVKDLQKSLKKTSRLFVSASSISRFRFNLKQSYFYILASSIAKGSLQQSGLPG